MGTKKTRPRLGKLPPKYNFTLNPYPQMRFSTCPDCRKKTGQRKVPLMIHVDPANLIALNYTNRYCHHCDMLIGHRHEIEQHLVELFSQRAPAEIGNNYLIFGTMEKRAWKKNIDHPLSPQDSFDHVHDFHSYQELRMTMVGWFKQGTEPPVMEPPPAEHWKNRS